MSDLEPIEFGSFICSRITESCACMGNFRALIGLVTGHSSTWFSNFHPSNRLFVVTVSFIVLLLNISMFLPFLIPATQHQNRFIK